MSNSSQDTILFNRVLNPFFRCTLNTRNHADLIFQRQSIVMFFTYKWTQTWQFHAQHNKLYFRSEMRNGVPDVKMPFSYLARMHLDGMSIPENSCGVSSPYFSFDTNIITLPRTAVLPYWTGTLNMNTLTLCSTVLTALHQASNTSSQ